MRLRVKNLNWLAGRPVVFLDMKTAKHMDIAVNERVLITNRKRVYAVVDIFSEVVKEDEIGLSRELTEILSAKNGEVLEVRPSQISNATYLIKKKINGEKLTKEVIGLFSLVNLFFFAGY